MRYYNARDTGQEVIYIIVRYLYSDESADVSESVSWGFGFGATRKCFISSGRR